MSEVFSLSAQLISAAGGEFPTLVSSLLTDSATLESMAVALKQHYNEVYATDRARALRVANTLNELSSLTDDAVVRAFSAWTAGLVALDEGRLADAVEQLDHAGSLFRSAGDTAREVAVQVGKMAPLAMQGRFDEAYETGLKAREAARKLGDLLTAGKVEQNLGNLDFVRQRYGAAEERYREARAHFEQVNDLRQLAQIDNCLATTLSAQFRFQEAEGYYTQAQARAEAARSEVTLAEIECNLGCLALYQGRYDQALAALERSRRRYAQLGMPHELAIAELELADAYLELNMLAEATALYARLAPFFAEVGMPGERARALAYHGRAAIALGQIEEARALLDEAGQVYEAADMSVGAAMVRLIEVQLDLYTNDLSTVGEALDAIEPVFAEAHAVAWLLQIGWLRGVLAHRQGNLEAASALLNAALADAQVSLNPLIMQRCITELGLVALAAGNLKEAEERFRQAVNMIEAMRAPLPTEEFHIGFIGDKLTPYIELVRICLSDDSRRSEALEWAERSRAQALLHRLGAADELPALNDEYDASLLEQLTRLRHELNWLYSQANRPESTAGARSSAEIDAMQQAARTHETTILTLLRQLQLHQGRGAMYSQSFELDELQRSLGDHTVLVEYLWLDDDGLLSFVVTGDQVQEVRLDVTIASVQMEVEQLRFQLGALRYGDTYLERHISTLIQRTRRPLQTLYDRLVAPLTPLTGDKRLVIVPHQILHYVPFHALYDGERYVIESREVCMAPSAAWLCRCLAAPALSLRRAVLVGLPDAYAPRVIDEVAAIAPLFVEKVTLLDEDATHTQLQEFAPTADLLHMACHGRFRSDSPFFSSLHLADGWMTVHDVYALRLKCGLVTLSACETGLSAVTPGDDLVGLARGFFRAGAPALLVSLWMVDDDATAQFMYFFYRCLISGVNLSAALRQAQLALMQTHPHPFYWAPFVLLGRW